MNHALRSRYNRHLSRPSLTQSWGIACLVALAAACAFPAHAFERGVNMAGPQFGRMPGVLNTDYGFNTEASFAYFGDKGLGMNRVGLLWERIQPELRGPLDQANVNGLNDNIAWAKKHHGHVVIELHNYGRYNIKEGGKYKDYIIDNVYDGVTKVTREDLCDVWVKISNLYKNEPGVSAYGLMNEPHDMGTADWKAISQAVVTAIRNNGDNKQIYVPGDSWSSAERWPAVNGAKAWITDPANNTRYEAHEYFDHDGSGTYQWTYDEELAKKPNLPMVGAAHLAPFAKWCATNNVKGYIGEFGAPNTDPRWMAVLDNFYFAADAAGVDATIWAAGERWGPYPLSAQPTDDFKTPSLQLAVMLKHPGTGKRTGGPVAINCGGETANPFVMDNDFTGGASVSVSETISTTGVAAAAPQSVYQSARQGDCKYTVAGLVPGGPCKVRLHFAETRWDAGKKRLFTISIGGKAVLTKFDIWTMAYGRNKAVVRQFDTKANGNGEVVIALTNVVDKALINGIEVVEMPVAPSGLTAIPGTGSVALSWKPGAAATSYNVKRSTTRGSVYVTVASPLRTAYTDTGLTDGVVYYYVVSSVNQGGESADSPETFAMPVEAPTGNAHSGESSVKIDTKSPATWKLLTQTANAAPRTDYIASVWLKGSGAVVLRVFNGSYAGEITRRTFSATATWQRVTVPFNTGDSTLLSFDIAEGGGMAGTVYLDDCFLGPPGGANVLTNGDFENGAKGWGMDPAFSMARDR
jgi:endoglucanase